MAAASGARPVVRVGTRASRLALIQTELTLAALREARPDLRFEVVTVTTQGDADRTASLAGMGLGVFVKEIERRLESGEIDMAVHSLKDMPTALPDGMAIGAVLQRADPGTPSYPISANHWTNSPRAVASAPAAPAASPNSPRNAPISK